VAHGNPLLAVLTAALGGAVVGFLFYNVSPASVFMGDTGSLLHGFFHSVTLLLVGQRPSQPALHPGVPLLVLGIPLTDTVMAMLRRGLRGRALFSPDCDHLHHRLLARGFTQVQAVAILHGACGLLAAAGLAVALGGPAVEWAALLLPGGAVLGGLACLGAFDMRLRTLGAIRRRNLELRATVESISHQLRSAADVQEVVESIRELAPAVSADAVHAHIGTVSGEYSALKPSDEALRMRFVLRQGRARVGDVELVWGDGRDRIDPEHALAIEEVCDKVAAAVTRLRPELASYRTPHAGLTPLRRNGS
jgi:UDP-GlcNAc:undecaprenyl-phosphate GlcNAc-1-phosphate transferase